MSNLGGTVSAMDHICPLTTTIYCVPYVTNYEFPSHPTNFHDEVINHVAFISNFFNMQMSFFSKQMSGKMVINQNPKKWNLLAFLSRRSQDLPNESITRHS
jgi:hypothetical protein